MKSFKTVLSKPTNGRFTYFELPFDARDVFDIKKGTIRVYGTINDVKYREKLTSKGSGKFIFIANKKLQKQICFTGSELEIDVTMDLDKDTYSKSDALVSLHTYTCDEDILTAIKKRCSIRTFEDKKIEEEKIEQILEAGFCAPSAKGKRPWHFLISTDSKFLNEISDDNNHKPFKTAPSCIIVCGDKSIEGMNKFLIEDCAAATQNILLAIQGLGLGATWVGLLKTCPAYEYIINYFSLPDKIVPINLIALGYPDEHKSIRPRYDASRTHWEKW